MTRRTTFPRPRPRSSASAVALTTKAASGNDDGEQHPVRAARMAAGYTQQSLADAVGVTRQTILSIEAGNYAPSVVLALRIARCCDTTVEALWGSDADQT